MKEYSKNPDITEFMEMPCMCDCGNFFDLNDGYSDREDITKIVCGQCNQVQELEEEIETIVEGMEDGTIGKRQGKKDIKELEKEIKAIREDE